MNTGIMRHKTSRTRTVLAGGIVLALIAGLFLLAGCGGDATTTTAAPSTEATAAAERTTATEASVEPSGDPIKVGVVSPISGPGAILGQGIVANAKLWAEQLNAAGGLLGRPVELLIQDTTTDPKTAAEKAKFVIGEGVDVLTGPVYGTEWGAVRPVAAEAGKILLQPVYYHGGWYDDLLFMTGEVPEQHVDKFIPWLVENYGKKFYFIGSDYNYPHAINRLAEEIILRLGGEIVGEEYVALGTTDFTAALARISKAQPDVVFGNVVGTDAIAFMKQFYDAGLNKSITMYEPIDQSFVSAIGVEQVEGVAVAQGYFETLDTPTNKAYVEAFKKIEPNLPPVDISTSAYVALQFWAEAVRLAGTTDPQSVKVKLEGLTLTDTPVGEVTMRATDHHTTRHMYIAIARNGILEVVEDLGVIEPGVDQRQVNRE
ncbi:MAG: substrate-binding protein [Thermoleophilia bacterium]|nr:substrate-binding protein [Thermoleophilia bacterium]